MVECNRIAESTKVPEDEGACPKYNVREKDEDEQRQQSRKPSRSEPGIRRSFYGRRAALRVREGQRYYHELLKRRFSFLVPAALRVLEFGCSLGDLLAAVRPARGVGVDFSPAIIDLARRRHPELEFHATDALEFSCDEKFDYILL